MEENINKNNRVTLKGRITQEFEYSHEVYGEKFFRSFISVTRTSMVEDVIPIMVSERLIPVTDKWSGGYVRIKGEFRSNNVRENDRSRLILSVFVRLLERQTENKTLIYENEILLEGYICKDVIYRTTPKGREIADLMIAVNRNYSKCDYIPCIAWGRNAYYADALNVGTKLKMRGRVQSREYQKQIDDTNVETRIAYEVSLNAIEELDEEKEI